VLSDEQYVVEFRIQIPVPSETVPLLACGDAARRAIRIYESNKGRYTTDITEAVFASPHAPLPNCTVSPVSSQPIQMEIHKHQLRDALGN
jgi:hypothetical protein